MYAFGIFMTLHASSMLKTEQSLTLIGANQMLDTHKAQGSKRISNT